MQDLFYEKMKELLQDEFDNFKEALTKPSVKGFYTNINKKNVIQNLDTSYIEKHPYIENGYYFDYENYKLGRHPYFNCGLYYIQEPSAMVVASTIEVSNDDYILDMCGAPGGKSCQIGAKLSNKGLLIANDITPNRASILRQNVERFGLENTIVTSIDPVKFEDYFTGFFDKIILDAPCSGEGMFRKLDLAVDTWSIEKINECVSIQKKLITSASKLLKPGGMLVYSTCTYEKAENEDIVDYAIEKLGMKNIPIKIQPGMSKGINNDFVARLYPHKNRGEGHFVALLQNTCELKPTKVPIQKPNISKSNRLLVEAFYKENLNIATPINLYESNNHIYAILPHFPELKNVRILMNGLYLGECKKNRFEPSLALALTLSINDVKRYYNYKANSDEVSMYLQGHTLTGSNNKGYGIIFVDGYPLSFYKESNNQVKNLYPKGLRR